MSGLRESGHGWAYPAKSNGALAREEPSPLGFDIGLLQIGQRRQVELAGCDKSRAAPVRAESTRVD
jgi:hypothetical protein